MKHEALGTNCGVLFETLVFTLSDMGQYWQVLNTEVILIDYITVKSLGPPGNPLGKYYSNQGPGEK